MNSTKSKRLAENHLTIARAICVGQWRNAPLRYNARLPFAADGALLDLLQMLQLSGGGHVRGHRGRRGRTARATAAGARTALGHRQRLAAAASQCRTQVVGDLGLDEQLFENLRA